jgi:hypothetical protein
MIDSILESPSPLRTSPRRKFAGKGLPIVKPVEETVDEEMDEFGLDDMLEDSSDEEVATPPVNDVRRDSTKPLSLSVLGTVEVDSGSGSGSSDSE